LVAFAERTPYRTPSEASPTPLWVVHHHQVVGDNAFELNIPPFLGLHLVFNVDLLRPYFPPLLDTSEITEQLTPTELNPTAYNRNPVIILWTNISRALASKGSSFIELSKQGSSCTKESGSPGAKFNKISSSNGGTQCNGYHCFLRGED
jgi:hypothetical protein